MKKLYYFLSSLILLLGCGNQNTAPIDKKERRLVAESSDSEEVSLKKQMNERAKSTTNKGPSTGEGKSFHHDKEGIKSDSLASNVLGPSENKSRYSLVEQEIISNLENEYDLSPTKAHLYSGCLESAIVDVSSATSQATVVSNLLGCFEASSFGLTEIPSITIEPDVLGGLSIPIPLALLNIAGAVASGELDAVPGLVLGFMGELLSLLPGL